MEFLDFLDLGFPICLFHHFLTALSILHASIEGSSPSTKGLEVVVLYFHLVNEIKGMKGIRKKLRINVFPLVENQCIVDRYDLNLLLLYTYLLFNDAL